MKKTGQVQKTSKSKPKTDKTKSNIPPSKTQSKSIPKKQTSNSSTSKEKKKIEEKKGENPKPSQFKPEKPTNEKSKPVNTKIVSIPSEKNYEYTCLKTIKAHNDWVQKLIILKNNKIISCSQDNTLKLWDLITDDIKTEKKPIFVYKGHTDVINDVIQYTNEKIVSVSRDKTLKQWSINKGKEISSYNSNMPFSCIKQISDIKIALGSGDKSIRFYDLSIMDNNIGDENMNLEVGILTGHQEEIRCLECYDEKTLFSGGSDNKIKVWDILNKKFLFDLEGHVHGIQCLKLIENGKKLLSGGYDNVIRVWDWEKKNQEFFLEGHTGHIMCIDNFDDQFIVSAGTDWSLIIWDLKNKSSVSTLEDHDESVNCCLVLPNGCVCSGSSDQTIKVWGNKN